jgi:dTDP-glucose 4,6-dehydratase
MWILGSHLCDRFINEGYFVIAMDNLITGEKYRTPI